MMGKQVPATNNQPRSQHQYFRQCSISWVPGAHRRLPLTPDVQLQLYRLLQEQVAVPEPAEDLEDSTGLLRLLLSIHLSLTR